MDRKEADLTIHIYTRQVPGAGVSRAGEECLSEIYEAEIRRWLPGFMAASPARMLPYLAWDLPRDENFESRLPETLEGTDAACFALLNDRPLAAAFAVAMNPSCAMLHLWSIQRRPMELECAGTLFIEKLKKRYKSLYCLIPTPFRGAISLAASLGFRKGLSIPDACDLRSLKKTGQPGRLVSGLLMALEW